MTQRVGETWTEVQAPDFGLLALAGPPPCPLPLELGFCDGQGLPSPWVQSWRVDRKGYGGPPSWLSNLGTAHEQSLWSAGLGRGRKTLARTVGGPWGGWQV